MSLIASGPDGSKTPWDFHLKSLLILTPPV